MTKIGVRWLEGLVEADNRLVDLGADAADEPITEWRHLAE